MGFQKFNGFRPAGLGFLIARAGALGFNVSEYRILDSSVGVWMSYGDDLGLRKLLGLFADGELFGLLLGAWVAALVDFLAVLAQTTCFQMDDSIHRLLVPFTPPWPMKSPKLSLKDFKLPTLLP